MSLLRASAVIRPWAADILLELSTGPKRFNALLRDVEGINDRVLHLRLEELERAGLVDRQVIVDSPIRVFFAITARGQRYLEPLKRLAAVEAESFDEEVAQAV